MSTALNSSDNGLIAELSMKELLARFRGILSFTREERTKKAALINRILQDGPPEHLEFLRRAGYDRIISRQEQQEVTRTSRKRRHAEYMSETRRRTAPRRDEDDVEVGAEEREATRDTSHFLDLPTDEDVKASYRAFYEATSNESVAHTICGVCAREVQASKKNIDTYPLSAIPNADRLIPRNPHPAHDLFDGKLLDPAGVVERGPATTVNVCTSCLRDLQKLGQTPPKYSLANDLWIGKVPWQLRTLSFPEQLLIALLFPRVYVFKLFPKKFGGERRAETLQ